MAAKFVDAVRASSSPFLHLDSDDELVPVPPGVEVLTEITNRNSRHPTDIGNSIAAYTSTIPSTSTSYQRGVLRGPSKVVDLQTPAPAKIWGYKSDTFCWRCGQDGHDRRWCANQQVIFCSRCGTLGLMSRDCKCVVAAPKRPALKVPHLTEGIRYTLVPLPKVARIDHLYMEGLANTINRPRIPIHIGGRPVSALINTGATHSCLQEAFVEELNKTGDVHYTMKTCIVKDVRGHIYLEAAPEVSVVLRVGDHTMKVNMVVISGAIEKVEIGCNLISQLNMSIDLVARLVTTRWDSKIAMEADSGALDTAVSSATYEAFRTRPIAKLEFTYEELQSFRPSNLPRNRSYRFLMEGLIPGTGRLVWVPPERR